MSDVRAMDALALHHELLGLRDRFDLEMIHHDRQSEVSQKIDEVRCRLNAQAAHVIDPAASVKCMEWSRSICDAGELTLNLLRQNREERQA